MTTAYIILALMLLSAVLIYIWTRNAKYEPHFDHKHKEPHGIGKTIPQKKKYSDAYLKMYYRNEIGRISKHIHSK